MESNKFKLAKIALVVAIPIGIVGCFHDDKTEDSPVPPPPTEVVETPPVAAQAKAGGISVILKDANGALLTDAVTATITFTNETNLLDSGGEPLTDGDKTTSASLFGFTVSEIPAEGITYKFTVSAPGYISTTADLTLNANNTSSSKEITLTPTNFTSTEVAIVVVTETLAEAAGPDVTVSYDAVNGLELERADKITVTQSIDEALKDTSIGGTAVSIKTGTKFIDASGNALDTAPAITVGYFGNDATATATNKLAASSPLTSFPGGMSQAGGSFVTTGLTKIELRDETGVLVKTFGEGNSLDVVVQIDKNTANPCPVTYSGDIADLATFAEENGFTQGACQLANAQSRNIAANDIYPVWSYETATGWSFESYSVLTDSFNASSFDLTMEVDHLSSWGAMHLVTAACDSVTLNFTANTAPLNVIISLPGYLQVLTSAQFNGDNTKITIDDPLSVAGKLRVIAGGETVATENFTDLCDLNNTEVTIASVPETVQQTLTAKLVCEANANVDAPAAPVTTPTSILIRQGNSVISQAYLPTGTTTIGLLEGVAYSASVQRPGTNQWIASNFTASTTALDLSIPTVCETAELPITGTGGA
jgi:hypothetical protein